MKKLVYIGFAFQHHKNTHGGYHHIQSHVHYDYIINCQKYIELRSKSNNSVICKIKRKILNRLIGTPVFPWFIIKCILLGLTHNNLVFHFIYGENIYFKLKPFIRKGNKIVCTLHQPFEWFEKQNKWNNKIKELDGIILMSNLEIELFKKITQKDNIKFIPHGISTDFYSIDKNVHKEDLLLTVGNWLRDYKLANHVYQSLLKQDEKLKIVIVSTQNNKQFITPHKNIYFASGISDKELLELYRKSSVLFLPLIRYTANNALLEAGACGCNIIIATNHPDNSYIPNEFIQITNMEQTEVVSAINKSYLNTYNENLSTYISREYSWDKIGEDTYKYLIGI